MNDAEAALSPSSPAICWPSNSMMIGVVGALGAGDGACVAGADDPVRELPSVPPRHPG